MPKYALFFMIFTLAALGLPGTTGFVGEFLVLIGVFKVDPLVAVSSTLGIILAAAYMLWLYKRVVFGNIKNIDLKKLTDLSKIELLMFISLAFLIIFFGFYPDPLIKTISISVNDLIENYQNSINNNLVKINN